MAQFPSRVAHNKVPLPQTTMSTKPESDTDDALRKEREANVFPLSRSPFNHDHGFVPGGDQDSAHELEDGELRVRSPEEVPWIDLLLEIAMTTAFAGLTDGTPILQWQNALSYVLYFGFVWWVWISQVAYNMRFRQADWLHRIWMFAQLIVFSALAAFTKDFDITTGLFTDTDAAQADQLRSDLGYTNSDLDALRFQDERFPLLNARGVSMTMAASRLILLMQYVVVFHHARNAKRTSLLIHMIPLGFSSLCYLAAFFVLGSGDNAVSPSQAVSSIKLVLWFLPILIELASHYVALHLPGFVRYSTESIYNRTGTLFLIILGAGLDKITGGFKAIVGNAGLRTEGIPLFISAAVIFIGFFSLYFATPGTTRGLGNKRALTWFFCQFFFLSALIVALQGIATSLQFSNLIIGITKSVNALVPMFDWVTANPGLNLTASDFQRTGVQLRKLGISLDFVVEYVNEYVKLAVEMNNADIISSGRRQLEMSLVNYLLTIFDARPGIHSLLETELEYFLYVGWNETAILSETNYWHIIDGITRDRGSSALWFYPAAGGTILALVLTSFVKGLPRDKWDWGVIISRLLVGSIVFSLAFLSLGSSKPIFDTAGNTTRSIIWTLTLSNHQWLLIILAAAMIILQILERLMAFFAHRSYYSFNNVHILNVAGVGGAQQAYSDPRYGGNVTDLNPMPLLGYSAIPQAMPDPGYTGNPYNTHQPTQTIY